MLKIPHPDTKDFENYNPSQIVYCEDSLKLFFSSKVNISPNDSIVEVKSSVFEKATVLAVKKVTAVAFLGGIWKTLDYFLTKGVESIQEKFLRNQLRRLHKEPSLIMKEIGATYMIISGTCCTNYYRFHKASSTNNGLKLLAKTFLRLSFLKALEEMSKEVEKYENIAVTRSCLLTLSLLINHIRITPQADIELCERYAMELLKIIDFNSYKKKFCQFFKEQAPNILKAYPGSSLTECFENSDETFPLLKSINQVDNSINTLIDTYMKPFIEVLKLGDPYYERE
ncbi:hypothetical protein [uncultured Desulfobacter sp.]|uniref:hypothetical protein n=1 Tax=uncultured Desulfobacter sp. TaxID=240139 RepID=UPI0029C61EE1|nr:hypothetical protein [uncultured Desulfobacter sp.]